MCFMNLDKGEEDAELVTQAKLSSMAGKMKIKTKLGKSQKKSGMEFLVQICISNANCVR